MTPLPPDLDLEKFLVGEQHGPLGAPPRVGRVERLVQRMSVHAAPAHANRDGGQDSQRDLTDDVSQRQQKQNQHHAMGHNRPAADGARARAGDSPGQHRDARRRAEKRAGHIRSPLHDQLAVEPHLASLFF